jgi:hypothetical protein
MAAYLPKRAPPETINGHPLGHPFSLISVAQPHDHAPVASRDNFNVAETTTFMLRAR